MLINVAASMHDDNDPPNEARTVGPNNSLATQCQIFIESRLYVI